MRKGLFCFGWACLMSSGILPFLLACYGAVLYAQTDVERRLAMTEINLARQEERYHALVARIDAIDKTLWWLVVATFGGTGISGAVAADRVAYRWRKG